MAKLFPPYIEGTLPAFGVDTKGNGVMSIPFTFNKAVSASEIKSAAVKIKTVQNDLLLGALRLDAVEGDTLSTTETGGTINIPVSSYLITYNKNYSIKVAMGISYKIQIAFIDNNGDIGYYSTVGVIKCTSIPIVEIEGFSETLVNNNAPRFIGTFKQNAGGDVSEKVYSSNFTLIDTNSNVIYSTGDVLHNINENANSYSSKDIMEYNMELESGKIYKIQYSVTTTNGMIVTTPWYLITQQKSLETELKGNLIAINNREDGYVDIKIEGYRDENSNEEIVDGTFILSREDSLSPNVWNELSYFTLSHEFPSKTVFRDFTIEQGRTYTYSIQQANTVSYTENGNEKTNIIYSNRKKSNIITPDFDDMFLYDGKRQLKLNYNPSVSSFKTQLSESKTDTIGSKYPYFFRNGAVGYKTFPISGMVSMRSDEEEYFISYDEILRDSTIEERHNTQATNKKTLSTVSNIFTSERLFKLEVLDWLNDGKVKLFKSPGEGNYLVRLMETSYAPQQSLGRMLHTVSTTAYEAAEITHNNLISYGIIEENPSEYFTTTVPNWREILIKNDEDSIIFTADKGARTENLFKADAINACTSQIKLTDMMPGTTVRLVFSADGNYNGRHLDITIGSTGNYYADDIEPVYGIYLMNPISETDDNGEYKYKYCIYGGGTISYQYDETLRNEFNSIAKVQTDIGAYKQLCGVHDNLIANLTNIKDRVTKICSARFFKRPVEYLYYKAGFKDYTIIFTPAFTEDTAIKLGGLAELNIYDTFGAEVTSSAQLTPSSVYNDGSGNKNKYMVKNLVDGSESTYWYANSENGTLTLHFENPTSLGSLRLRFGNMKQYWSSIVVTGTLSEGGTRTLLNKTGLNEEYTDLTLSLDTSQYTAEFPNNIFSSQEPSTAYNGYRAIQNNYKKYLSWDLEFSPTEYFDDQESMEYSPYSLYVLRDISSISGHITNFWPDGSNDPTHIFEKYYIDKVLKSESAQELVTRYSLVYKEYLELNAAGEDTTELKNWIDTHKLLVLDAWSGNIYTVGADWVYDPAIKYNNEEIDLREIDRYESSNLNIDDNILSMGNGVYGDIFYQKVTLTYVDVIEEGTYRNEIEKFLALNETYKKENTNQYDFEINRYNYNNYYEQYCVQLAKVLENWTKKVE